VEQALMNQPGWAPLPVPPAPPPGPYFGAPPPPPPKPSSTYKALGIVQAALGAAGVLYALFSVATTALATAYGGTTLWDTWTLVFSYARAASSVLTGALLVATGIGVFRAKRWSRPLGVTYAVLSLLSTFGGTAITVLVVQPRMFSRMHVPVPHELQLFSVVTSALTVLFASILPVVTLVFLLRARAKDELDQ
jgi:hypothetical protein